MHAIAHGLSLAAGAAFILIGSFALAVPQRLARTYGSPVTERGGLAFVRATGIRDMALGAVLIAAVLHGDAFLLRVVIASGCIIALADLAIAYTGAERRLRPEHAAHLAGAIGFALILIFLI